MTWTAPLPEVPVDGAGAGELLPIVEGYLATMRATLLNLCAGLTAEQLCLRSVPPSTLSLLGLVRHMTKVERTWFRIRVAGEDVAPLFPAVDSDFDGAEASQAPQALLDLQAEWTACDEAVAGLPHETTFEHRGEVLSLGLVFVHLVHEYARHNGHGDLLRQAVDGATGR